MNLTLSEMVVINHLIIVQYNDHSDIFKFFYLELQKYIIQEEKGVMKNSNVIRSLLLIVLSSVICFGVVFNTSSGKSSVYAEPSETDDTDKIMVLDIDFQRYNGEKWILGENDKLLPHTEIQHFVDESAYADQEYWNAHWKEYFYWYEIKYYDQNENLLRTETKGSKDDPIIPTGPAGIDWYGGEFHKDMSNVAKCKVIFHNLNGKVILYAPDYPILSEVIVDGDSMPSLLGINGTVPNEVIDAQRKTIEIASEAGSEHKITMVGPVTYDGTISFDSPDASLADDGFRYNFGFWFTRLDSSNADIDYFYWNYPGDSERHYAYGTYGNRNYYYFSIPMGEYVEVHNMPIDAMFEWTEGNPLSSRIGDSSAPNSDTAHTGINVVTLNGENIGDGEDIGISSRMHTELIQGEMADCLKYIVSKPQLPTSGSWEVYMLGEGFEVNVSISRRPVQFMFSKVYAADDELVVPEDLHHFEVTLNDTMAETPFTEKVAYYIYDSIDDELDADEDVQFATPDESGKFDVYLKSGQYIKIGRIMTPALRSELLSVTPDTRTFEKYYYYAGTGEIPYGISYSIKEVSDNYTASVTGDAEDVVKDGDTYHYYVSTSAAGDYRDVNLTELKEIMQKYGSEAPVFTNTRNVESLSVEKLVQGELDEEEFEFSIELKDNAAVFPTNLEYSSSLGTSASLKLTADAGNDGVYTGSFSLKSGEKITITGIPAGTEYSVTESLEPNDKYTVKYTDCEGKIKKGGSVAVITNIESETEEEKTETTTEKTTETTTEATTESTTETSTEVTTELTTETTTEVTTGSTTDDKTDSTVKTGDDSNLFVASICMFMSFVSVLCLSAVKKKRK